MIRVPLIARPLDFLYFCFFLIHIPASLLLDFQILYPSAYVPSFLQALRQWYIGFTADPLIAGAVRGDINGELVWFGCFTWLELLFQFPTFFLGIRGLWKGSHSTYVLTLAYGASTATTTLPCIFYILKEHSRMTPEQQIILLSSYVPFFVIPLLMAVDMGFRVYNIVASAEAKRKIE
ncbi:transmembrane protein 6/97 [Lentinula aciculospora]|uniref:Efficient mitochondria targeting-associated protein 19 n=1 Tax=Lentinula aciculospora TaxID=153920 RepID=A0A9W9A4M1_9AGAR|nr:transmembrane protein 6/97 [Lentinula aciculospora]